MKLSQYASIIKRDWKKPSYAAAPYIEAMHDLDTIQDTYFFEDGRSIVAYFLANAGGWRGEIARTVKGELKEMLK